MQIDITGDEGDLRIVNTSAFGDVGDDYRIFGARGNAQPLLEMPVPASYDRIPESKLPSAVLELAELYAAHANDVAAGSRTAPVFEDAVVLHRFPLTTRRASFARRDVAVSRHTSRPLRNCIAGVNKPQPHLSRHEDPLH